MQQKEGTGQTRQILIIASVSVIAALSVGLAVYTLPPVPSGVTPRAGSVAFGSEWQYKGNVTLQGEQSSCAQLRLSCSKNSSNQAYVYAYNHTKVYVESPTSGPFYTIVLVNGSSYCISPPVSWIQQCPSEISDVLALFVYQSAVLNQEEITCSSAFLIGSNGSKSALSGLISNVESYPKFVSLEGNRTYQYEYWSCGYPPVSFDLTFSYYDTAHPFEVCDNTFTKYPEYQIVVGIDLIPNGYDLYHSVYSTFYYGPQNTTIYCTTTR